MDSPVSRCHASATCVNVRAWGQALVVDHDAVAAVAQGSAHHHAAARKALADGPRAQRDPGDLRGVHAPRGLPAGSIDAGQRADGALRAVAADQVPGGVLATALRPVEGYNDAVRPLADAGHLVSASHRDSEFGQPVAQHLLGPGLRQA